MKKDEILQGAYIDIAVTDEMIVECERRKSIAQKIAKLLKSDLADEFLNGCESYEDARDKFNERYGFLL